MVIAASALVLSVSSDVHAAMDHHDGVSDSVVSQHDTMQTITESSADCASKVSDEYAVESGLNCCSAMCSAVAFLESKDMAAVDERDRHFDLPLHPVTPLEPGGFLRPPSI